MLSSQFLSSQKKTKCLSTNNPTSQNTSSSRSRAFPRTLGLANATKASSIQRTTFRAKAWLMKTSMIPKLTSKDLKLIKVLENTKLIIIYSFIKVEQDQRK